MFNETQLEIAIKMRSEGCNKTVIAGRLGMSIQQYLAAVRIARGEGVLPLMRSVEDPWDDDDLEKVVLMRKKGLKGVEIAEIMGMDYKRYKARVYHLGKKGAIPCLNGNNTTQSIIEDFIKPMVKAKNKPWSINMGEINPNYSRSTRYKWV